MKDERMNPAHKRALRSALHLFETALRNTERELRAGEENGILFQRKVRMDSAQKQQVLGLITSTLEELEGFARELGITPVQETVEGAIMARMSLAWENLENCRPERMKGYGYLDTQAAAVLDPAITHLAQSALQISRLAELNIPSGPKIRNKSRTKTHPGSQPGESQ
jgi:hypothetical protein